MNFYDETTSREAAKTIKGWLANVRLFEAYSVLEDVEVAILMPPSRQPDGLTGMILRRLMGMSVGHALEALRAVRMTITFEARLASVLRGESYPVALVAEAHLICAEHTARRVA